MEPIFRKLKVVHEDFFAAKKDDWPYWYRERSQIGFLAAAVWLSGGAALEEYRWEKSREAGEGKGIGRCDLWIGLGGTSFCCEAKWLLSRLTGRNTKACIEKLSQGLRKAEEDLRKYEKTGLSLCFVTPWMRRGSSQSILDEWLGTVCRRQDWQAVVWIGLRTEADFPDEKESDIWHGLLLVVREVKPRLRTGVAR